MPGLVPGNHVLKTATQRTWMAGTSPAMMEKLQEASASPMSLFAKLSTYDERSARLAGIGLMLLSIFMFSFGDALGKFMVATYSVGQLMWLRACAALLVLSPLIWGERAEFKRIERIRQRAPSPRDTPRLHQPDPRLPGRAWAGPGQALTGALAWAVRSKASSSSRWSRPWPPPTATRTWPILGARVIKVERPEGISPAATTSASHGDSSYFVWLNRGKESLVADLKHRGRRALLERILARPTSSSRTWRPGPRPAGSRPQTPAGATTRPDHARHLGLRRRAARYATRRPTTCWCRRKRDCQHHRPPRRTRPGRRLGRRRRLRDVGLQRGARGPDRARDHRPRQGPQGQPVRRGRRLDERTAALLRGHGSAAAVGLAHPSICPYGAFPTRDGALVLISVQNEREWAAFCARFLEEPDMPPGPATPATTSASPTAPRSTRVSPRRSPA